MENNVEQYREIWKNVDLTKREKTHDLTNKHWDL